MAYQVYKPVPVLFLTGGVIGAIGYTATAFEQNLPTPAKGVGLIVLCSIILIAIRYFGGRRKMRNRIVGSTPIAHTEIALFDDLTRQRWNFGCMAISCKVIDETLAWWIERFPKHERRLRSAFKNEIVGVWSRVFEVNGIQARGYEDDTQILAVSWLLDEDFNVCANIMRHELGHLARKIILGRYWGTGDDDHQWFAENNYSA